MPARFMTIESRTGIPVQHGDLRITPVARSLRLQMGQHLGLIWNRPSAILVEAAGSRRVVPVVDVTRLVQWSIWGLALAVLLAARLGSRTSAKQRNIGE